MRNLKRALSLTLASVMLLGMMVVGSSAAGFPDVDDEDNVEAIEVLNAVEVILGYDNGDFGPDDLVTRAQMAVIMAKLLKLDYQYYEASCPFTDVPAWARGYVGACYANGITSGYSATIYGSDDGITPVQAASMMMRALGYFKYAEDYKDGFEVVTVRQGSPIGIFDGVGSSASAQMTRNQVAKMALNALESEMVTFTGTPGTTYTSPSGETLSIGYRAEYTPRTSTELKYKAIEDRTSDVASDANHKGQYYVQLGEELYDGKLTRKFERDEFERPSINWQYNGKEIGTYVDYSLKTAEFLTAVTGAEMYDELTYTTINDNDLLTYVDGVDSDIKKSDLVRSNKNDLTGTGTGVLTEVFVDLSRDEVTITSINTWLAKANSDYNSTNDSLSLKVYTNRDKAAKVSSSTKIVDGAKVAAAEDVKKDEYKLVYMSGKDSTNVYNDYARFDVVKIFDVEILPETAITKWAKSDTKVSGDFTADGTVYKTNAKAYYDGGNVLYDYNETLLTDMSYNVFLDKYGNAIGVDLAEGTKNYVFITGYDRVGSNISVKTADAAAIFLDGTMDVITVNVKDTNKYIERIEDTNANFVQWTDQDRNGYRAENRWYTYTVNNSGVYTLKPAERMFWTNYVDADFGSDNEKILNCANLYVDDSRATAAGYTNLGRAYGNDDSVYITVEAGSVDHSNNGGNAKDAIVDVKGTYTGAQDVKLSVKPSDREDIEEAYVYTVYDSNYYIIASIVLGDAQGTAANYAYILDGAKNERIEYESAGSRANGDATYYWEFDAVLNGEKQTLTAKSKYRSTIDELKKFHVQELRFDGDYVTSIVDVKNSKVMGNNVDKKTIDKMDVYDVGHVAAANAFGEKVHTGCTSHASGAYGYSNHRLNGTIELVGRTLYTERPSDVGLALATDAKAVLVQVENGKTVSTQCASVSEAIGRLADADTRPVAAADGIQFQGRIVAVLKDGVAQWVVIISDTELRTNDKDYNTGSKSYLTWDKTDREWYLEVPASEWVANPTSTQIARWLENAGCSNVSVTRKGWNFTFNGYDYEEQTVNVMEPVVADTYTITKGDETNGTFTVSATSAAVGTTVTITATPNPGYKVGTVTVTGATVSGTGNTRTFVMPAQNVTVNVTFEAAPVVSGEYTVVIDSKLTSSNSEVIVNGALVSNGDKVEKADTITLNPANALDITWDDAAKTVTIAPKANFNWSGTFGMWMGVDANGNLLTVPFDATMARLRMARAGVAAAAEIPEGPVDTKVDGWFGQVIRDYGATYTITVGSVVWTGKITAGGTTWARTSGTVAQAQAAIGQIDSAIVEKTGAAPEEPTIGDPQLLKLQVDDSAINSGLVTFLAYFGPVTTNDKFTLTREDIAAALTAVDYETKAENVDLAKKEALTEKGVTIKWPVATEANVTEDGLTLKKNAGANDLYQVTLPSKTVYIKAAGDSVKLDDFKPVALIDKDEAAMGDTGTGAALNGTGKVIKPDGSNIIATGALTKDKTYVEAFNYEARVMASGTVGHYSLETGALAISTSTETLTYKAYASHGASGDKLFMNGCHATADASSSYIAKGAYLTFEPDTAATHTAEPGQVLTIKVNGKVVQTVTVAKKGVAPAIAPITITEGKADPDPAVDGKTVNIEFSLGAVPASSQIVYFNGNKIEAGNDGLYHLTGIKSTTHVVNEVAPGVLAAADMVVNTGNAAGKVNLEKSNAALQDLPENQRATYTYQATDAKTTLDPNAPKEVWLWTANKITVGSKWAAAKKITGSGEYADLSGVTAEQYSGTTFVKTSDKVTVYVKSANNGDYLWLVDKKSAKDLTLIKTPVASTSAGIWSIVVTGEGMDLTDDTLEAAYELNVAAAAAKVDTGTWTFGALNVITIDPDGDGTFDIDQSDGEGIAKVESISFEKKPTNTDIEFDLVKNDDGAWCIQMITPGGTAAAPTGCELTVKLAGSKPFNVALTAS